MCIFLKTKTGSSDEIYWYFVWKSVTGAVRKNHISRAATDEEILKHDTMWF